MPTTTSDSHHNTPGVPKKRAWVKIDKYIFDYLDNYDLSSSERHLLYVILLEVAWQTQSWTGSITDLSGRTRMSRATVTSGMKSLVAKGILITTHDFKSNNIGVFTLTDYFTLIIPEVHSGGRPKGSKDSYQRERTEPARLQSDTEVHPIRTESAPNPSYSEQIETTNTLMMNGNRYNAPREAEIREGGTSDLGVVVEIREENLSSDTSGHIDANHQTTETLLDLCAICGYPQSEHGWGDTEACEHFQRKYKGSAPSRFVEF